MSQSQLQVFLTHTLTIFLQLWAITSTICNYIWKLSLYDQIRESENVTQTSIIVEITEVIHKLKNSNSVGWENIPTNIIKANINVLLQYYQI